MLVVLIVFRSRRCHLHKGKNTGIDCEYKKTSVSRVLASVCCILQLPIAAAIVLHMEAPVSHVCMKARGGAQDFSDFKSIELQPMRPAG